MLLERVIAAHGGRERWQQIDKLRVKLRVGGNILMTRWQSPSLRSLECIVDTRRLSITISPFTNNSIIGSFDGNRLQLIDQHGTVIKQRDVKRDSDGNVIKRIFWDELDLLYFFAYALWNYMVTPFVFLWPGFECQEISTWQERDGTSWERLKVIYPRAFPTHCREQIFYFNQQGLLTRLDYTADVFSRLARGAHYCQQHKNFTGLMIPTHRVVYPRRANNHPIRLISAMEGWIDDVKEIGSEK
jgi:hypothetical protein